MREENSDKVKIAASLSDASRQVVIHGQDAVVPLKFDKDGNPATEQKVILKRLTLTDLSFLKIWREVDWDIQKATEKSTMHPSQVERLVKKLQCFREEDARVKALAEIPTPGWIAAKQVQNVYEGGTLTDSEHKSLQELAKISGAYKPTQSVSVNINLEKPAWTPEQEAKLREVYDTIATPDSRAA